MSRRVVAEPTGRGDDERVVDPSSRPRAARTRPELVMRKWAVTLFVLQRTLVVAVATTPWVTPDEYGAWAIAAALVGGGDAPMSMRDTPGYPLMSGVLLAPVEALGLTPTVAYRLALVWLSLLLLAAALLVRSAIAHLRPDQPVLREGAFALVLLFPATTVTTSFTWSETAVLLWWSLFLAAAVGSLVRHHRGWTVAAGAVAGLAPVVHGRLMAVPLIWLCVLAIRSTRRTELRPLAASAVLTVAVAASTWQLQQTLAARVWDEPGPDRTSVSQLGSVGDALAALLTTGGGQLWYALVASAGLGALGGVAVVGWIRNRPSPTTPCGEPAGRIAGERALGGLFAAALGSNLVLSVAFMARALGSGPADRPFGGLRWDHVVYGRYIDAALLMLCVFGLVWLADRSGRRCVPRSMSATAGATSILAAALWIATSSMELGDRLDLTIAGVAWLPTRQTQLQLVVWTLAGVAAMLLIAAGARRSPRSMLTAIAAWLVVGSCLATITTLEHHSQRTRPELAGQVGGPRADRDQLHLAADVERLSLWRLGLFAQQRDLVHLGWDVEVVDESSRRIAGTRDPSVGALVLVEGVEPDSSTWAPVATFGGTIL